MCRIGEAISRTLWLSGHIALRYEIGTLIENAAAYSNNVILRARTLIDDLGWTAIKLGKRDLGWKHINDGIRLGVECSDHYVVAKGYRHLASLHRQKGESKKASSCLSEALKYASSIADDEERTEMRAALQVSEGKLKIACGQYGEAITSLNNALEGFRTSGDIEREVKVYAQLAHCNEKLGDIPEAERLYLLGRDMAHNAGRFDEFANNTRALVAMLTKDDPARCLQLAREAYEFAMTHGLWDEASTWQEEFGLSQTLERSEKEEKK